MWLRAGLGCSGFFSFICFQKRKRKRYLVFQYYFLFFIFLKQSRREACKTGACTSLRRKFSRTSVSTHYACHACVRHVHVIVQFETNSAIESDPISSQLDYEIYFLSASGFCPTSLGLFVPCEKSAFSFHFKTLSGRRAFWHNRKHVCLRKVPSVVANFD